MGATDSRAALETADLCLIFIASSSGLHPEFIWFCWLMPGFSGFREGICQGAPAGGLRQGEIAALSRAYFFFIASSRAAPNPPGASGFAAFGAAPCGLPEDRGC